MAMVIQVDAQHQKVILRTVWGKDYISKKGRLTGAAQLGSTVLSVKEARMLAYQLLQYAKEIKQEPPPNQSG